jgi:hypothetical protein
MLHTAQNGRKYLHVRVLGLSVAVFVKMPLAVHVTRELLRVPKRRLP